MKAQEVKQIKYAVVMIFEGQAYTEQFTFEELFFYNSNEEREVVFALNEDFEDIIKMKQGDQMPVRVCRDINQWGVLERIN